MKKAFTLLTAILIGSYANAFDFEVNGIYYNIKSATEAEVTHNGDGTYKADIIIPDEVEYNNKTLSVVSIGCKAFYKSTELKSITIGKNVVDIESEAFEYCSGLTSSSLPENVKNLKDHSFAYCTGLTSIFIPANIELIYDHAFYGCSNSKELTIENGVKGIDKYAFGDCSSLTKVSIPASVQEIGTYAFWNCTNMHEVNIEDCDEILKLGDTHPWYGVPVTKLYLGRNMGKAAAYTRNTFWQISTPIEYTVGDKVTSLDWLACKDVTTIILKCTTPPTCDSFSESQYAKVKVFIPIGTTEVYKQVEPWKNFWSLTEGEPTGIHETYADNDEIESIHSVNGCCINSLQHAINIVKTKSGKVYKVIR